MKLLPRFILPLLLLTPASAVDVLPMTHNPLDDLIAIVVGPGDELSKRSAIDQIRNMNNEESTDALINLFGAIPSESTNNALLYALVACNTERTKLALARFADHPKLGPAVLRTLQPSITPKDISTMDEIFKRIQPYEKIPVANLSSALDIFASGKYKPALPFIRELAAKPTLVQITAVYKLGDLGGPEDLPLLWTLTKDTDAQPSLRTAAVNAISSLGTADDANKLLAYARSFPDPGDQLKNFQQYIFQSQNRVRVRLMQSFDAQLEITSLKNTAAGLDLDLAPIENVSHVIVAVTKEKILVASALVSGPHIRLALPAGQYDISLTPILAPDTAVLRVIQNDLRNLIEPQHVLRLGRPTLAGNISIDAATTAKSPAILNAAPVQTLDDFVASTLKSGLPATTTGPFVIEGTLTAWGSGKPPLPAKKTDIPIAVLYSWGLALVDQNQSIQIITILRESFDCSTRKPAHVVGYLAPYRDGSDKFVFYALEMWNPPD